MKLQILKNPSEAQVPAAYLQELKDLIENIDVTDPALPQDLLELHFPEHSLYADYNHSCRLHNFRSYRITVLNYIEDVGYLLPEYSSQVILALNQAQMLAEEAAKKSKLQLFFSC